MLDYLRNTLAETIYESSPTGFKDITLEDIKKVCQDLPIELLPAMFRGRTDEGRWLLKAIIGLATIEVLKRKLPIKAEQPS